MSKTTVAQALKFAQAVLINNKIEGQREAEYLLGYILNWSRSKLIAYPEYVLTPEEHKNFIDCVNKRKRGLPVAYIKKNKSFWNIDLEVDESVLIPRPDTELLVETILSLNLENGVVLDLGTGSGAIAIALGVNQPRWQVHATDMSDNALNIARHNAKKYKLSNIDFYQGFWFEALFNQKTNKNQLKFDIIVSNPPYISADSEYLNVGDVRFEPIQALVAPNKGLADLEHIIKNAKNHLKAAGYLLVEHGYNQAEAVQAMFSQAGFSDVKTLKDIQDHDRITYGKG